MRTLTVDGLGKAVPVIGQGTWGFGEASERTAQEIDALRLGIEAGMTLIDTAEYYAAGGAERVVGEAIQDVREQVVLVTKVWPRHRDRTAVIGAVEDSLRRLGTEYVDAVLWHWPTRSLPLEEVVAAFSDLERRGLARTWGVSNFWSAWWDRVVLAAEAQQTTPRWNQMPYAVNRRAVEQDLLDRVHARRAVLMAYSPLGHGRLLQSPAARGTLEALAQARGVTAAQLALAFVVRLPGVVAVAKAVSPEHVQQNAASDFVLTPEEVAALERAFPVQDRPGPVLPPYRVLFSLAYHVEARRVARRDPNRRPRRGHGA
jgi:diketogulonate reductase-like aldo/keto reductase